MKDKACHTQWFWDVYKAINFKQTKMFPCSWCESPLKIKWKNSPKTITQKFCSWLLWMAPAIILIALVAKDIMWFGHAIVLIIFFHFIAMYFLIHSPRLIVKNIETKKKKSPTKKKTTAKKILRKK